jgi:hypothetical protein
MYTVDVIVLGLGSVFSSVLIFAGHFNRSGKSVLESEVVQVIVEHLAKRKVHMINHESQNPACHIFPSFRQMFGNLYDDFAFQRAFPAPFEMTGDWKGR